MARSVSRHAAVAGRSADGLVHDRRDSADAAGEPGRRAGDSRPCRATRSQARTPALEARFARDSATRIASHLPVDQPHLAFVNATRAGGVRDARSRGAGRHLRAERSTYPNNGFALALRTIAGAMVQGRGHEGVLGADRRLRHARGAEPESGERVLHQR